MFLLTVVRWELLRLGLGVVARAIAGDAASTSARRSRSQHLRDAIATLLVVAREVSYHRNFVVSLRQTGRKPARADLRRALSELRRAEPWRSGKRFASRHPWGLLIVTSAGVAVADRIRRLRPTRRPDDVIQSATN